MINQWSVSGKALTGSKNRGIILIFGISFVKLSRKKAPGDNAGQMHSLISV